MTTLWHKRWYQDMHHDDMVCMLWEVWSLMCTSHVAGNTQRLVSMGKVCKDGLCGYQCNGKEYTKMSSRLPSMIWHVYIRTDDVEVVNVDDDLVAMMSGGVLVVDLFLISRNTLGNWKTTNSKSQMSNGGRGNAVVVVEAQWDCGNAMMGFASRQCRNGG